MCDIFAWCYSIAKQHYDHVRVAVPSFICFIYKVWIIWFGVMLSFVRNQFSLKLEFELRLRFAKQQSWHLSWMLTPEVRSNFKLLIESSSLVWREKVFLVIAKVTPRPLPNSSLDILHRPPKAQQSPVNNLGLICTKSNNYLMCRKLLRCYVLNMDIPRKETCLFFIVFF